MDELKLKYGEWKDTLSEPEKERFSLFHSITGQFSDFARDVIGTDRMHFDWMARRLRDGSPSSPDNELSGFGDTLTPRQSEKFSAYLSARLDMSSHSLSEMAAGLTPPVNFDDLRATAERKLKSFRRTLGKWKLAVFEGRILPRLRGRALGPNPDLQFDISLAQRWIANRVFELGWTPDRFGWFDRMLSGGLYGIREHKAERIGKKYSWIAYHEFLAHVSDNFVYREGSWEDRPGTYEGPWQLGLRDIDPSTALPHMRGARRSRSQPNWWFNCPYQAWKEALRDEDWIALASDLPDPRRLVRVNRPDCDEEWLVLEGYYAWEKAPPPDEDRYENPRREIWYQIRSYIVAEHDANVLVDFLHDKSLMGRWMPESPGSSGVFLGEFHWSRAYAHSFVESERDTRLPCEVSIPVVRYEWDGGGYDQSEEGTLSQLLPASSLCAGLELQVSPEPGTWVDTLRRPTAFDPSVHESGPSALLVRRDALEEYLTHNRLAVVWTVLGQKWCLGGDHDVFPGSLDASGTYTLSPGGLRGELRTEHRKPWRRA
jgi:hypothetical protein